MPGREACELEVPTSDRNGQAFLRAVAALVAELGIEVGETAVTADAIRDSDADRVLFDATVPPSILVDSALDCTRAYRISADTPPATLRVDDGFGPRWRQSVRARVETALREGTEQLLPPCGLEADGVHRTIVISALPVPGTDQALVTFANATPTHDALRKAQKAARDQTAFLEAVIENIPMMIFVKEAKELRFVRMNRAGEQLLGVDRNDLLGKNDYDLFPAHEADFFTEKDRHVLQGTDVLDIAEEPIHAAEGTRFLHTKKVPLRDPDTGAPRFLLGISEDITERRDAVEAIERARAAAEAANLAKSRFLANMSHELRTPLTAILGYTELLLEESQSGANARDLRRILQASNHLLSVISSVLDLSKIEAGTVDLAIEPVDLHHVFEDVVQTVQPVLAQNDNRLEVSLDPNVRTVRADALRLRQCLINLVANGSKFTTDGEIGLHMAAATRDGLAGYEVRVTDTGIGMTEEQVACVFEPFYQADTSGARRFGGTGLGLTITHRFVSLMGGTIDVESELGVGSTFRVWLPVSVRATH